MVLRKTTKTKGVEDLGESPYGETAEGETGELSAYPNAFRKIASYSGTTRIMKCKGNCGAFDDIINIYVDPEGAQIDQYKSANNRYMNLKGNNDVDPSKVSHKDLTFWKGKPKSINAEYRHKKKSKPVKRSNKSKRTKSRK